MFLKLKCFMKYHEGQNNNIMLVITVQYSLQENVIASHPLSFQNFKQIRSKIEFQEGRFVKINFVFIVSVSILCFHNWATYIYVFTQKGNVYFFCIDWLL